MAFGFAGAGAAAANSLEEILAQQMIRAQMAQRKKEQSDQVALQTRRAAQDEIEGNARIDQGQQQINLGERRRRDDNNDRGLDLMRADRQAMDMDAALGSLPPHLKPIAGLFKAGAVGKLGVEDFEDPAVKAKRTAAAREQAVQDQIRVRNATREPKSPEQIFVKRGEQVIPIQKGTAIAGDIPYDQVAARSSKPENDKEAIDTANEAKRLASALVSHKGFGGAFGLAGSYLPTVRQDTADAEALLGSLQSMLTMENMGKMKGVLSDSDMKVLRQASTTLSNRMSEGAARDELNRVVEVMGRVAAGAPAANAPAPQAVDPRVQELIRKYGGGG